MSTKFVLFFVLRFLMSGDNRESAVVVAIPIARAGPLHSGFWTCDGVSRLECCVIYFRDHWKTCWRIPRLLRISNPYPWQRDTLTTVSHEKVSWRAK